MAKDTQDRTETLAEHREAIQHARAALYDNVSVDDAFYAAQGGVDALEALANVSLALWGLTVAQFPEQEVGPNELPYTKVRQLAPMQAGVAHAVNAHAITFKELHKSIHAKVCDHEEIIQDLTRALAGYGDDVGMPVLAAAKELDLSTD